MSPFSKPLLFFNLYSRKSTFLLIYKPMKFNQTLYLYNTLHAQLGCAHLLFIFHPRSSFTYAYASRECEHAFVHALHTHVFCESVHHLFFILSSFSSILCWTTVVLSVTIMWCRV